VDSSSEISFKGVCLGLSGNINTFSSYKNGASHIKQKGTARENEKRQNAGK